MAKSHRQIISKGAGNIGIQGLTSFTSQVMARKHPRQHEKILVGARWWKVDFHTHTGHSDDAYQSGDYSDRKWLLAHMRKEIDAVCITDHNGGGQVDLLKAEYDKMYQDHESRSEDAEPDFRELVLFPGVELTTSSGYHCLVILDPAKGSADVSRILGGNLEGEEGSPNSKWNESPRNFVSAIDHIMIPAHIDGVKGLFRDTILKTAPESKVDEEIPLQIDADERAKTLISQEPKVLERWRRATEDPEIQGFSGAYVYGSDSHEYADVGHSTTWVKMEEANLDALRVAIADKGGSILDGKAVASPPCPDKWISSISIADARHMGRQTLPDGSPGEPLVINFNPGLNAIIGGRGTGKSTILEILRRATKRSEELDSYEDEELRAQHDSLVDDSLNYEDGDPEVRINFDYYDASSEIAYKPDSSSHVLHEEDAANNPVTLDVEDLEISTKLPFRIYGQKQLYRFRKDTSLLLQEIDDTLEVDESASTRKLSEIHSKSLALHGEIVALANSLKSKKTTEQELKEINKRIKLLKDSKNSKILTDYSLRKRQSSQIVQWLDHLKDVKAQLTDTVDSLELRRLELDKSEASDADTENLEVESYSNDTYEKYKKVIEAIEVEIDSLADVDKEWEKAHQEGKWQTLQDEARKAYEELSKNLASAGQEASDPKLYKSLVEKRERLEQELSKLQKIEKNKDESNAAYRDLVEEYFQERTKLSKRRERFLVDTFAGRTDLKLSIKRFGDRGHAEATLRSILHRHESSTDEFANMMGAIFPDNGAPDIANIKALKEDIREACKAAGKHESARLKINFGKRLVDHLRSLTQDDLGRLELWYPADKLNVKIEKLGSVGGYINLDKASPGQVAAAALAILLAYGDQPLILDQPEDDLDNKMIFKIIVSDLISNKSKRQVIIVTHNANLVVNTNADLIFPLESDNGITTIPFFGALQNSNVRQAVCSIMEGGEEALSQRFNRMIKHAAC